MKDFFKFMFASMLGFIITLVIAFFLFIAIIASIINFAEKQVVEVESNTVLKVKLDYPISDRTPKELFSFSGPTLEIKEATGLNEILKNLDKAATDDNIKGIYLNLGVTPSSISTLEEIRNSLIDFKKSGKFVVCYSEGMTQSAYYLGSVADNFFLHPDGLIDFKGLGAEMIFLKGTLEKIGIDVQVIREGKFKSAIEPLVMDKMSEANREQIQRYLDRTWEEMLNQISESRAVSVQALNETADKLDAYNANKALEANLVDELFYADQMYDELRNLTGIDPDDDINFLDMSEYVYATDPVKKTVGVRDKIAVVYAIGSIESGKGDDKTIGSERISKAIRQARRSEKVKAIVMRVNSPGGSALASEVIRREVELAAAEKPFIISMGDVAASGGYWISVSADKIYADPTTLTGSIGVFGIIPNMQEMFNDRLGITFDYANTNKNADFPLISKPLPDYQKEVLKREVNLIYEKFLALVAKGRGMSREEAHELAQGRIWNAVDAMNHGLIDELGGMEAAIEDAATLAGLDEYKIWELPFQKDPFDQLIEDFMSNASTSLAKNELGEYYTWYEYLNSVKEYQGIQARLPFVMNIQ